MSRYIGKYVSTCDMCRCTKTFQTTSNRRISSAPDSRCTLGHNSIAFIMELPESNGRDSIMVVVDSITKHSNFVSMVATLSSIRAAQLYIQHIWRHHRLPNRVMSDRGPQFVAEFTKEIY